jgi:hypothetical protein
MMHRFPIAPRKRRILELCIRVIDIVIYFLVFGGGIYALFFTPLSVQDTLSGWEWLIPVWSAFLLVGGGLGALGRITTFWILEPPADVAAFIGVLIYGVVLFQTAFTSLTSAVATFIVFVALLGLVRRYIELHLFGSDPKARDFRSQLEDTWNRRIPNVPNRG